MVLEELMGLTDEEFMDSLLFDICFQYALHTTSFKEQPVSDRTFSRFRRRCLTYETETGIDLIPANKRLADAAARLQVMQLSQYNTAGEAETLCEEVMDKLNISYSTYQKAHDDLLSTIAVFAAHYGEL